MWYKINYLFIQNYFESETLFEENLNLIYYALGILLYAWMHAHFCTVILKLEDQVNIDHIMFDNNIH